MLVRTDLPKVARELRDGCPGRREGGVHVLLALQLHVRDVGRSAFDRCCEVGQLAAQLEELSLHLRGHANGLTFDLFLDTADLALTKSVAGDPVAGDDNALTYTIEIENFGPSTAEEVEITDNLPAGAAFKSLPTPSAWPSLAARIRAV